MQPNWVIDVHPHSWLLLPEVGRSFIKVDDLPLLPHQANQSLEEGALVGGMFLCSCLAKVPFEVGLQVSNAITFVNVGQGNSVYLSTKHFLELLGPTLECLVDLAPHCFLGNNELLLL